MAEQEAIFRFNMEETIYFQENCQVDELHNIELIPDVSIRKKGDYISIKGNLSLKGNYTPSEKQLEHSDIDTAEIETRRYIEEASEDEDGFVSFSHTFPIEVAVPEERVTSIDDVAVGIQSLDYNLIEKERLDLLSTVTISGILDEDNENSNQQDEEDEDKAVLEREIDQAEQDKYEDSGDSFTLDVSYEKEEDLFSPVEKLYEIEKEEQIARENAPNIQLQSKENIDEDEKLEVEQKASDSLVRSTEKAIVEDDEVKDEKTKVKAEIEKEESVRLKETRNENEKDKIETVVEEDEKRIEKKETDELKENKETVESESLEYREEVESKEETEEKEVNELKEDKVEEITEFKKQERKEIENKEVENKDDTEKKRTTTLEEVLNKKEKKRLEAEESELLEEETELEVSDESNEEVPYSNLAKLFGKEDEESYSSLRLYIVQENDTLDTIAERYEIPVSRILQYNRLLSEDLGAGQLIYIPYK